MAKYEILAEQIKTQIDSGVWMEHDKLPSLRKKSAQSGYSLMTVLHAYQILESQGYISSQERSGYIVTAKPQSGAGNLVQTAERMGVA